MPMKPYYNPSTGKTEMIYEAEGGSSSSSSGASASSTAKLQDTKGLGSKAKDAFVPPKMNPNEDSAAYSERVRKAREAHNQKKAMK